MQHNILYGDIWSSLFNGSVRNNTREEYNKLKVTLKMMFDEDMQMTTTTPTGKQLILICPTLWKNTQRSKLTQLMVRCDYPQNNGKIP